MSSSQLINSIAELSSDTCPKTRLNILSIHRNSGVLIIKDLNSARISKRVKLKLTKEKQSIPEYREQRNGSSSRETSGKESLTLPGLHRLMLIRRDANSSEVKKLTKMWPREEYF